MKLGMLYAAFCLFALLGAGSLGAGLYQADALICAVGILLLFAAMLIFLEARRQRADPFQQD